MGEVIAAQPGKPGPKLTPGQREEIVALLALGDRSQADIARQYGISEASVSALKTANAEAVLTKKRDFGSLAARYLETLLNALTKQAEIAGSEDYIRKQPAGELAVLHGVLADKGFRLLAAVAATANNGAATTNRNSGE